MSAMPNVHIRDLPPEAVETLRGAAKRHGRSFNAEIVAVLVERAEQEAQRTSLAERLEEARQEWRRMNPDGYPPGLEPETIIREARDSR
jgi:plasmid stability protein